MPQSACRRYPRPRRKGQGKVRGRGSNPGLEVRKGCVKSHQKIRAFSSAVERERRTWGWILEAIFFSFLVARGVVLRACDC
jgi:hypothetical protein